MTPVQPAILVLWSIKKIISQTISLYKIMLSKLEGPLCQEGRAQTIIHPR